MFRAIYQEAGSPKKRAQPKQSVLKRKVAAIDLGISSWNSKGIWMVAASNMPRDPGVNGIKLAMLPMLEVTTTPKKDMALSVAR